ncbi:SH3 domain-containing protein 21 [Stegostoma tigrinum]|uniref:SH3 domain-containing protein 21 n=1 Tax=Stegostoma tigrinum TaxID=3053191 RepID=UPI00286FDCB4|nr:SH3 domain-containing protein 21 [Stegostoma tigrinum]
MVEMIAVSGFQSQEYDELSLEVGDIIKNSKCSEDDGWWEGELNGRRGRFPRIFVKEVASQAVECENYTRPRSIRRKPVVKKKKQRWCEVVISYSPVKSEELELNLGDVIEILDQIEDGWWIGRKNGQAGSFPSNFVMEIDNTERKAKRSITESDFGALNQSGPSSDIQVPTFRSAHPSANLGNTGAGRQQLEYYKAIFDYIASAEDELNLRKGDVILVLEKELEDEGWWEGYMDGKQGIFPDNYVVPYVVETEMRNEFLPGVNKEVDIYEKEEPKNEWSETVVKPGPPKKVPPPVKVKPVLSNLPNKVNEEHAHPPQDWNKPARDKGTDSDSMTFDMLAASTEKLTHLTMDRPKAKGRRPPSPLVATSNQDVKRPAQLATAAKFTHGITQQSEQPSLKTHRATAGKPATGSINSASNPQREAESEDKATTLVALRAEVRSLQLSFDLLKNQHLRDIAALKEEIAEERNKRNTLQAEVEKLRGITTLQKH